MTKHKLHINSASFERVVNGTKTIEVRLYDERRQRIDIGDEITLINRANNKTVQVKVFRLHRAPTFHDLFTMVDVSQVGYETSEAAEKSTAEFYDYNDELASGVVGIEFTLER